MKLIFTFSILILILGVFQSCTKLTSNTRDSKQAASTDQGSVDAIVQRSGTPLKLGERAMKDAQNRLRTGGGLFGKKPMGIDDFLNRDEKNYASTPGLPINATLWKSSIEVIEFMPIASADPFAGIIITDWYSSQENANERCKLNIFIKGVELRSDNLNVNVFCQNFVNQKWVDLNPEPENDRKIENAILNKAKKNIIKIN